MKRKRTKRKASVAAASKNQVRWEWHLAIIGGLLLANLALYWPALRLGFFSLDDPDYVVNNPYINSFAVANLVRICSAPYFANFSPLHLLSYSLDVLLAGGKDAFAMHLSNVLWNGFAVCMVYCLAFTIRPNLVMSAGAALLFLVHPAHVEVVAWLSSRKDLVATAFGVLTMTLYLLYRRQTRFAKWFYAASIVGFLLATAGKQSVVLLPAVMVGWDFFVEKRRGWSLLLDKIPFGLITILFALPTMGAQPDTRRSYDLAVLAANQISNLWLLTGLGDYVLYRPTLSAEQLTFPVNVVVIVLVAFAWLGPLLLHRLLNPVAMMLWYWILIQLIPPMVFSFITPITDRYLFLPSVGLCLLLAEAITRSAVRPESNRWSYGIAFLCVAGLWAGKTRLYLNEWNDPRSVWYAATAKSRAYQNNEYLGTVYQEAGDRMNQFLTANQAVDLPRELTLAEAVMTNAAQVASLKAEWEGKVQTKTESTAYRDHLWDLAWEQFELAVARRGTVNTPNLFMRRGMILVNRGRPEEAIAQFQQGLRLARTHSYERVRQENVTHLTRAIGVAYWKLHNYSAAKKWFLEAQQTQKASGQTWVPTLDQEVEQITRLAGNQ